jgi:putative membrane protein
MMNFGMMGGWGFFGFFFWMLVIAGIVLLVVWLSRRLPEKQISNNSESALDILKKRYALGEISREDFEKMLKEISKV